MVIYNQMQEAWVDTEDPEFKVSMSPEGHPDIYKQEYKDQAAFQDWYNA